MRDLWDSQKGGFVYSDMESVFFQYTVFVRGLLALYSRGYVFGVSWR